MPYGTIKVDTVTFTDGGVDKSVTVSGLVQNPTFSGNVTATGTISGATVRATTVSGTTVTGTTANFASGVFTTQISGAIIKAPDGSAAVPSLQVGTGATVSPGLYGAGTDVLGFSTGGAGRLFIDSTGRVGIGTSSPGTVLDIGDPGSGLRFQNAASGNFSIGLLGGTASADTYVYNRANSHLIFGTNNIERLRIDSAGLLAVGTATVPTGIHEIRWQGASRCSFRNMDATAINCYGLLLRYQNAAPNNAANEFLYCEDNAAGATQRAAIRSNGGFANYQANDVNLSDLNTKKDIAPADGTWNCLKQWEIVNYRYKDQPDDADLNLGVIAQQVAESCPEVVTVFQEAKEAKDAVLDEDGNETEPAREAQPERLGVKEQQMYWMAIKALQEAMERIENLEAKVAALEGA